MKNIHILIIAACANASFGSNVDDDDLSEVDDLPVVSAKTVFNYLTEMMHSHKETFKEAAKDTLQSLKSQMDDKSKQYAKLSLNGIRFAVNMGRSGSALRSENEAILTQLWNLVVSLFYNILSWFGFGDQHIDESYTHTIQDSDEFYVEDAIFMKTALLQQLCEIDSIIHEKQAITKYLENNSIVISETITEKIKNENFFELKYKNELEKSMELLEETIKAVDKEVEEDKKKRDAEKEAEKEAKSA